MNAFCVEIVAQTASFRNPEFQNFHKTLDLPPPTTIIGMAGAALGLSPKMAQAFFDETLFEAGVAGQYGGRVTDTWKYNRRTASMHLYDPLLDGSVIQREHMVHNQFYLAFYSQNRAKLEELRKAFQDPVFAITVGNSDSLAMIKEIRNTNVEVSNSDKLKNCLMQGDVVGEVINRASEYFHFSIYQTSEPIVYDLPVRFDYTSDYGKRVVSETAPFSFVGQEMQLNFSVRGILYKDLFIPLFKL